MHKGLLFCKGCFDEICYSNFLLLFQFVLLWTFFFSLSLSIFIFSSRPLSPWRFPPCCPSWGSRGCWWCRPSPSTSLSTRSSSSSSRIPASSERRPYITWREDENGTLTRARGLIRRIWIDGVSLKQMQFEATRLDVAFSMWQLMVMENASSCVKKKKNSPHGRCSVTDDHFSPSACVHISSFEPSGPDLCESRHVRWISSLSVPQAWACMSVSVPWVRAPEIPPQVDWRNQVSVTVCLSATFLLHYSAMNRNGIALHEQ